MKRTVKYFVGLVLCGVLAGGCSTTKRLPEEEVLYTGIKEIAFGHKANTKKNKDKSEEGVITSIAEAYKTVDELLTSKKDAPLAEMTEEQIKELTKEQDRKSVV